MNETTVPVSAVQLAELISQAGRANAATQADHDLLVRIDTRLEVVEKEFKRVASDHGDHEDRLRLLEEGHWRRVGAASLIATFVALLAEAIGYVLMHWK